MSPRWKPHKDRNLANIAPYTILIPGFYNAAHLNWLSFKISLPIRTQLLFGSGRGILTHERVAVSGDLGVLQHATKNWTKCFLVFGVSRTIITTALSYLRRINIMRNFLNKKWDPHNKKNLINLTLIRACVTMYYHISYENILVFYKKWLDSQANLGFLDILTRRSVISFARTSVVPTVPIAS